MELRKKQAIGENLLYFMVWAAIILVPVLNSKMLSELHVNLENILTAWRKIAPYLIIFLFHNSLFAPKLLLKHRYWAYLICDLLFITLIFWIVDLYEENVVQHIVDDTEQFADRHKASFTDLEIYWNIVLGFFMTGANAGIKLLYQSIRDGQEWNTPGRDGLSEIPDQSALFHEHAQQHPRPDRHRRRIGEKRRHRTVENDALRAL